MLLNLSIPKGAGIGRDGQASFERKARTTRQRTHLELGFGTYALRPPETVQRTIKPTLLQRGFFLTESQTHPRPARLSGMDKL